MKEQIIIAGFGGQGVMSLGQLIAYAGMKEDKNVSWLPSYGPEMRGGTANCHVIVSDDEIAAPFVSEADTVIVMNLPSLLKFEKNVIKGGNLFINSSLIDKKTTRDDINVFYIPANDIANDLGNSKVANMVIFGGVMKVREFVGKETVLSSIENVLGAKKAHLVEINVTAMSKGAEKV